ncbi:hypothetical protein GGQ68_003057 [Sagittula marina]|uniref:Uncharacterized protein n=1 Tax=Sagittula marina TaxID=943940 RepID=A0A7W6DWT2_9RHOB|nr:hypothetical protein [Sagittula marina]
MATETPKPASKAFSVAVNRVIGRHRLAVRTDVRGGCVRLVKKRMPAFGLTEKQDVEVLPVNAKRPSRRPPEEHSQGSLRGARKCRP